MSAGKKISKRQLFAPRVPRVGAVGPLVASLLAALALALNVASLEAAAEPNSANPRIPTRAGLRTNAPAASAASKPATNPPAVNPTGSRSSAPPTPTAASSKGGSQILDTLRRLPSNQAFFPAIVALVLAGLLLVKFFQSKSAKAGPGHEAKVGAHRRAAIQWCNVLEAGTQSRQLWGFEAHNGAFKLDRSQVSQAGEPLPSGLIGKSWRSLWQPKLNVAWLPPEQVFLRVAQFPRSDFQETLAMVELQLEKLSPMPVAQIVWSIVVLPHTEENLQTVVVTIAARNAVEEFLGQLEGQGYMADRIELPFLDQLRATHNRKDGAWIYPETHGLGNTALVAWWDQGVLQNLDLIALPVAERAASVREQLLQTAWGGELEGWLKSRPHWYLVANSTSAAEWEPALRTGLEQSVEVVPPVPPAELAALTAQRAAHAEPGGDLLPREFSTRYQEQFYDRLWMRGLLALAALYGAGVVCYLGAVEFLVFRARSVESEWAALSNSYTNAIQLKARYQVLKEREDLKFAALNCYRAVAETMPEGLTLDGWNLSEGRRLNLNGSAPRDQAKEILDFDAALRKAAPDGRALFLSDKGEHATYQQGPQGLMWRLTLELNQTEGE